jgi:hypothetical protein
MSCILQIFYSQINSLQYKFNTVIIQIVYKNELKQEPGLTRVMFPELVLDTEKFTSCSFKAMS